MSITPQHLPRRSSIWSVLRSIETLSSPPSWSSLPSLATHSQVGSIPLIFRDGGEDSPASISYLRFDTEQDVSLQHSNTAGSLDHGLDLEGRPDDMGTSSRNSQFLEHRDKPTTPPRALRPYSSMTMDSRTHRECPPPPACSREAHPLGILQVATMTPPRTSPVLSKPELASQLRSSHGDSSTTARDAHDSSLDSCRSSLTTGELSSTKESRLHEHDSSTSLRSNLPLATHDGVHTLLRLLPSILSDLPFSLCPFLG